MVHVLETERLFLRHLSEDDAPFILALLNEPSFLHYIGDKGVRTVEQAKAYLRDGPVASYQTHGYGLYLVGRKPDGVPIGMCGLVNRDTLADVDIGYAFLPDYWGQGYALEAARVVMDHALHALALPRVVAVTSLDNVRSGHLLEKLGLRFERVVRLQPDGPESKLYT